VDSWQDTGRPTNRAVPHPAQAVARTHPKGLGSRSFHLPELCPPHGTDPDASELPFCRDLDGFVYVPEPWELARQLRLQRHAQQRDHLAGIVIYDGDCNATSKVSIDADPGPPTATACQRPALEHPCPGFPDEFDQRSPEELTFGDPATGDNRECPPQWDEYQRTWDPCAQQWQDTPLAKWARSAQQHTCADEGDCGDEADRAMQAAVWDNIDTIPPEDEPVFPVPQEDEPVFFTD
jgi:hypothetical protein